MKSFYFIFFTILICSFCNAQIITIPDADFKNALVNTNCVDLNNDGVGDIDADTNNDGEIEQSEVVNITDLYLVNRGISSLEGISFFNSLERLWCPQNNISTVDLSLNLELRIINCEFNQLTALDLSNNPEIIYIKCNSNQISEIDVSQNGLLQEFYISDNLITQLDVSFNPNLGQLVIQDSSVTAIFMKNGDNLSPGSLFLENCPNLQFICVDASEMANIQNRINFYGYTNCVVNSYCSFEPGGDFFTVDGVVKFDLNEDGCDSQDLVYPNLKFNINTTNNPSYFLPDASGNYVMSFGEGNFTITPEFENPEYYNVTPSNLTLNFPDDGNSVSQDFCITPNGSFQDLEVYIVPLDDARPGFDANYKLVYKNKGNTMVSGTIGFEYFNDDFVTFVSSSPVIDNQIDNTLSWNYANLLPFESREIAVVIHLNPPTDVNFPLNGGDILSYNAQVFPSENDAYINDNQFSLRQLVVNSFDPNDKRCLQGESVSPDVAGEFVHYLVRFENTGSASAINVVIKDVIDTSAFDISSLVPLGASHDFVTRIQNTNEVEFIFETINLPFDDANNDGYVVFKIKTLETLTLGDSFSNDAEIYFDFNFPILTNDYVTTIEDNLAVNNFELGSSLVLFPNPVVKDLTVASDFNVQKAAIYDLKGRLLQTHVFFGKEANPTINVEHLSKGIYLIILSSKNKTTTQKIVKQ